MSRSGIIAVVACVSLALVPGAAHAYLDPATGSLIIQTLVGGLAAAALVVKTYWRQIKTWFGGPSEGPGATAGPVRPREDRHGDD